MLVSSRVRNSDVWFLQVHLDTKGRKMHFRAQVVNNWLQLQKCKTKIATIDGNCIVDIEVYEEVS